VVAPSAIPFADNYVLPEALSTDGITKITDSFVKAAQRALKAGFRIVEIIARTDIFSMNFFRL